MRQGLLALLMALSAGCEQQQEAPPQGSETRGSETGETRGEAPKSDSERLQGVWSYASVDIGETRVNAQKNPEARLQIQGDRVTITESKNDPGEYYSLTLDTSKEPKWMTLTLQDAGGQGKNPFPIVEEWIYKFEGEDLIVALGAPIDPWKSSRPAQFKAQAWIGSRAGQPVVPSVFLWKLKKTDEPFFQPRPRESRGGSGK